MKTFNTQGFSLLEVMLALVVFTVIAIGTTRHLQQLSNTKTSALSELDAYNAIRAANNMMRSDLNQAFHVLYEDLGSEIKTAVIQNQAAPHTVFDGRKNEIIFTSTSHRVYYSNLKECEQTEISYFLRPTPGNKLSSLMKRNSGLIDADLYAGGEVYSILENVISLEFLYWDDKTAKWVDKWNSDDGEYRDRFPMAIRMKIHLANNTREGLKLESDFKIAFPNNEAQLVQF